MTPTALGALLLGLVFGGALCLLVAALRGWKPNLPSRRDRSASVLFGDKARRRLLCAIAAGPLTVVLTRGWPVAGIAVGALIYLWPVMFGGTKEAARQVAMTEAVATLTETLRDSIAGSAALEDAIRNSVRIAPPPLRAALRRLEDSTRRYGTPMPQALAAFAAEFNDGTVDRVVGSLILASRLRGEGLKDNLSDLADATREEVKRAYMVEAGRKSIRRDAMLIVGVGGAVGVWFAVFQRQFVAPYSTFTGQLVLVFVLGFFAAGLMWIRNSAKIRVPKSFLAGPEGIDRIIHRRAR